MLQSFSSLFDQATAALGVFLYISTFPKMSSSTLEVSFYCALNCGQDLQFIPLYIINGGSHEFIPNVEIQDINRRTAVPISELAA